MHLTLVISSLNPGGAERVLSALANHWISKGHQVSVVNFAASTDIPFYQLDPKINLIQLDQTAAESSFLKRSWNVLRRILCLRNTLKKLKSDVIVSFTDLTNMTTLIAALGLKVPVIVSERTNPFSHKIPKLYEKMRHLLYPKASKVVVQTESAARYFARMSNITVIPNAIAEVLQGQEGTRREVRNLVSVGRLCPFKGFAPLIQAFSHLLPKYPDLTLTIYGEGAERGNLEKLIAEFNLQDKVHLPGVTQNIQEALLAADMFVFPSLYEGFPNALCEAMAVGLPVIASNCSGNIDVVQDGIDGRLFPVGDVDSLVKLMEELIKNPEECQRLSLNAQKISERFHPTRILKLWDDLLADVSRQLS